MCPECAPTRRRREGFRIYLHDEAPKSGGFRTIYVFGGTHMPIFLITVFAKNEKGNLSKAEQAAAVELSKRIVAAYGDPK